jgi:hypothetical protein
VRRVLSLLVLATAGTAACRVLSSGLPADDTNTMADGASPVRADAPTPTDEPLPPTPVEQPGIAGSGCSDGTREGFRDSSVWPVIAGCAGGFSQPGVIGALLPTCAMRAGDSSNNPAGIGCSAADLCTIGWHVCLDGTDVKSHSPTGDCEGCVLAGEPRFFLVATGATSTGICTSDRTTTNDLHGCGGLGQPESGDCPPLDRRMGFADCLATAKVWSCGTAMQNTEEAAVVTKNGPTLGGVLCCKD